MTAMVHSALAYAQRFDFAVFPVNGKIPYAGTHGFKDASKSPEVIHTMWTTHPNANVGIATGSVSGIDVIDIDPRNGGNMGKYRNIVTPSVHTGGGGLHLYCCHRGRKLPKQVSEGVDIKSEGGYIVAPPSIHPNGNPYVWYKRLEEVRLTHLPEWIKNEQKARKVYDALPLGFESAQVLIDKLDLRAKRGEYVGQCPFHVGTSGTSFYVNFEKSVYICFGCGKGGPAAELMTLDALP